jgi:signal peptide peptidase SppA
MKNTLPIRALSHDLFWAMPKANAEYLLWQLGLTDAPRHDAEYAAAIEARSGMDEGSESKPYQMFGSVALIKMDGAMTRAGSSFGDGSTVEMRRLIRRAVADSDVKNIVLLWNSPGGSVDGTEELADDIAAAARKKPVCSYMTTCCSAALWCAVQAGATYCNRSAYVGSIGVFSYAVDMSQYAENEGIKVTLYSTGKYKGSGVPGVPISDEQHAENQRIVDVYGEQFRTAVSQGRDMSMSAVEDIADGRCWIGEEAVKVGLVDKVISLDDLLSSLNGSSKTRGARAEDDQTISASDAPLLTGVTLKAALDTALTAGVGASEAIAVAMTRAAEIKDRRKDQARSFSPERLAQVRELAEVTDVINAKVQGLLKECEALGHDAAVAEEALAEPQPQEPNPRLEALRAASTRAAALLKGA